MTREEAIEVIQAIAERYSRAEKYLYDGETEGTDIILDDEDLEALDMAISALKGGWIPLEERKPKHRQEVFVTYETEDGIKTDKTVYHERHGFAISPNVTAWREDIEPYKAESEDKE